jgi:hypothetical protein
MSMKVLGVSGSPLKNSNTDRALLNWDRKYANFWCRKQKAYMKLENRLPFQLKSHFSSLVNPTNFLFCQLWGKKIFQTSRSSRRRQG